MKVIRNSVNQLNVINNLIKNKKGAIGLLILFTIATAAALAPYLAPYNPTQMHFQDRFSSPSRHYLLGTDFYGRDILSRIMYGYRNSLLISFLAVIIASTLGSALGIMAGYFGSPFDALIMRTMDILFAFPVLLLAIVIVVIIGPGLVSTVLAIGIVYVPIFSRIARGPTLSVKEDTYVEAAKALGEGHFQIILKHILPNVSVTIFVQITISLATAILFESSLSFLGLGTQPPNASLGLMVSEGRNYIELSPWGALFPGLAIALVVLGFNLLGDGLQQILNPKLKVER